MKFLTGFFVLLFMFSCQKDEASSKADEPQLLTGPELLSKGNNGDLVLFDLSSVAVYDEKQSTLIGGTPADPKNWPASFTTSQGGSRCTGTILGPKTLQLAAHCVGNGRTATIQSGAKTYSSVCTHSPKYAGDSTADYALCLLSEPITLPWFESILTASTAKLKVGDEMVLAGMGCTQPGGGGGNNNVFRVGTSKITRMPGQGSNDIVTQGGAALCFGDSGGSAFWEDDKGVLRVAGVNSRGDIRTTSYLSATFTKDGNDFYSSWAQKNNAVICGLNDNATNCRGEESQPPAPSPVQPWCKATYEQVGKCIFGTPRDSLSKPEICRDEFAKLFACQVQSELTE